MTLPWKDAIRGQLGAAIDMLENAVRACPDPVWSDGTVPVARRFWYLVFHTLFWLDFYLSESPTAFTPPPPFGLEELDPAGLLPERPYTKSELGGYLEHGRRKCRARIAALTEAEARRRFKLGSGLELEIAELLLYNLRHVQHHAAQLNLILRQTVDSAPAWVSRVRTRSEVP